MGSEAGFGDVLSEVMRRRYIAAIDVARAVGVSPQLVERWNRGEAQPRPEDVETLASLLGGSDAQQILIAAQALAATPIEHPDDPEQSSLAV